MLLSQGKKESRHTSNYCLGCGLRCHKLVLPSYAPSLVGVWRGGANEMEDQRKDCPFILLGAPSSSIICLSQAPDAQNERSEGGFLRPLRLCVCVWVGVCVCVSVCFKKTKNKKGQTIHVRHNTILPLMSNHRTFHMIFLFSCYCLSQKQRKQEKTKKCVVVARKSGCLFFRCCGKG